MTWRELYTSSYMYNRFLNLVLVSLPPCPIEEKKYNLSTCWGCSQTRLKTVLTASIPLWQDTSVPYGRPTPSELGDTAPFRLGVIWKKKSTIPKQAAGDIGNNADFGGFWRFWMPGSQLECSECLHITHTWSTREYYRLGEFRGDSTIFA